MVYKTYLHSSEILAKLFLKVNFSYCFRGFKNFKINAFNLQSFFTVDINNHSAGQRFIASYSIRKKYRYYCGLVLQIVVTST